MKNKSLFGFIVAMQALLIPVPGRFVFGFTLIIEMNLIMVFGTLFCSLIKVLKLEDLKSVLLLFVNISISILFRQILAIFQAEVVLTLGFLIYIPAISLFVIGYMYESSGLELKDALVSNQLHAGCFSLFALFYFLIKDIVGFGTFTFYGSNHQILETVTINSKFTGVSAFLASIPGSFLLSAGIIHVLLIIKNKFSVISNLEEKHYDDN